MYDPPSLRPLVFTRLFLVPLALAGLTACGISFSNDFDSTEMFKDIGLAGDLRPGSELTVTLEIEQSYPVPVEIACFYENDYSVSEDLQKVPFEERARRAGSTILLPARETTQGGDARRQQISFRFTAPEPGEYSLACLTPAAPENTLGLSFEITAP